MAVRTRELRIQVVTHDKSGSKELAKVGDAGEKMGKDVEKGAKKAKNALDDVERGTDGLSVNLRESGREAGGMFSEAFGTALGLGIENAAMVAMDAFGGMLEGEAAGDRLAAQLGGSEWAAEMGTLAGDMYANNFGDSVEDSANAIRGVLQHGLLPEDATTAQIESLTGKLMTFTDVMGQDIDMTTQAISNMMRTGIAESGDEALDILTRGIQQGADRAGDLAETFQEYSTMFRDAGLSAVDATGLLTQGLQAGARDADTVADALKEFAIRGQDASDASAAGFEAIGLNAAEMTAAVAAGGPQARAALDQVLDGLRGMTDPAERNAAAVALFGTKAEDLGDALFALDLDTAAAALGNVEGSTDQLGSAYENAQSKIEGFRRKALEKLQNFVADKVIPALEGLQKWAQENPGKFQALAAVIGVVLVGAFLAWAVAAAQAAIATLAATWPVLAIIAVIALLVGALVWAYNNWGWFKTAVDAVASFFTDVLWPAIKSFAEWFGNNFVEIIKLVGRVLLGLATMGMSEVVMWIVTHWDEIVAFVTQLPGRLASAGAAIFRWVRERIEDAAGWVRRKFNEMIDWISGLPGRIADAAAGMWDGIKDAFRGMLNTIIRWWNNLSIPRFEHTFDPLGSFGPAQTIGIGGWELPNIPELGEGGIAKARPGGVPAILAEKGYDEAVVPLDGRHGIGGGDTYVVIDQSGAVLASEAQFRRMVADAFRELARQGALTVNGRRVTA